jgi:hypothetical protein
MLSYGQGHYQMTKKLLNAAIRDTESISNSDNKTGYFNSVNAVSLSATALCVFVLGYFVISFYLSGATL